MRTSESTGNLLLDFRHSQIPLSLVVVKGNTKIIHEGERFAAVVVEALQQVPGFAFFPAVRVFAGTFEPDDSGLIFRAPSELMALLR